MSDDRRYSISDKEPGDVPCGECNKCVCVGGKLVVERRSNGQGVYMQYKTEQGARAGARRASSELSGVEVVVDWASDIKIKPGMTHDEIRELKFVMRSEDAKHLRAVADAGEMYVAVLRDAHVHFDELMTAVQTWTHQHAVEFGLSCDVSYVQLTIDKTRKLLELGGAGVDPVLAREKKIDAALDAAFPGLPGFMTLEEARRRVEAALVAVGAVVKGDDHET